MARYLKRRLCGFALRQIRLTLIITNLQYESLRSMHTMNGQQQSSLVICVYIRARGVQETMYSCATDNTDNVLYHNKM